MIELKNTTALDRPPQPVTAPIRVIVPQGAWDTHAHVIGAPPQFPLVADRNYTPQPATPSEFIATLDKIGVSKGVVVQVSVHGSDHTFLKAALEAHPERLRGVAVMNASTADSELEALDKAGVVGSRVLEGLGGSVGMGALDRVAARCAELGWHVQLAAKGDAFPPLVDKLLKLPVPFVIDHMGWFSPQLGLDGQGFQAILFLLRNADCYVKLSGAFRMSALTYPHADIIPFAQRLVEIAPDRMFWGSDWPHVGLGKEVPMPQVGDLLDTLADYASDAGLIHNILVDNPERFYGRLALERSEILT